MSLLDDLKAMTTVVADSGDIEAVARHRPQDATTNPSLIYKAAQQPAYGELIDEAIAAGARAGSEERRIDAALDELSVLFGRRILELVPGRVSTEVDARLSFDTAGTIAKARALIGQYASAGVARERVLIKIASTWEGIEAARVLEGEGIRCNLTLLFGFGQAVACAEAGVQLISPFVGRIYDWYKADRGVDAIAVEEDPGVASVRRIFDYYKKFGFETEVMGASFRHTGQIIALAGCDLLTIAPSLLEELDAAEGPLPRALDASAAAELDLERVAMDERVFRWLLNEDAMATEKLAQGIRAFAADLERLRDLVGQRAAVRARGR